MALPNEKATLAVGERDMRKPPSTANTFDENHIVDNNNTHLEKLPRSTAIDTYPPGLKLALLAVASMGSVFLIVLIQVRDSTYSC
jgi:hypothetical protein